MDCVKPWVYISSPYSKGDPCINARHQCYIFDRLMEQRIVLPYAPLWSHFQHTMYPRQYSDWVEYDLMIIPRFDACLRVDAVYSKLGYEQHSSTGADREVEEFLSLGKPVFYSVGSLYEWALDLRLNKDCGREMDCIGSSGGCSKDSVS